MAENNAPDRPEWRRTTQKQRRQAEQLAASVEAQELRGRTFNHFHKIAGYGPDVARLAAADPEIEGDMWDDLRRKVEARRYLDGNDVFRPVKKPAPVRRIRPIANPARISTDRALDTIRSLPAADYLPAIAGVDALPGGRCRCPLPEHEDRNPSASWKGNLWHCHSCGEGGDLIALASRISGIDTRGADFFELARWIADRLLGRADQVRDDLDRRAA